MTTTTTTTRASRPGRRRVHRRPAASAELIAALAGKLTGRDRWLLAMLAEHRVLTTGHLAGLAFPTVRRAERRLAELWAWRCVDRFRPHTPVGGGSAPYHWVLDDAGAAVLAATHGSTPAELGYRRAAALAVAHSQRLAHTLGANTLLAALAGTGRLACWWGERRCAATWGDVARPDAAAAWHPHHPTTPARDTVVGFAVEYDTGTEQLARVAGKLADYADLAAALGRPLPVLFWLPTTGRETALHRQFDPGILHTDRLPVATAAADHAATAGGPAGPVWRPAHPTRTRAERVTLDQLTGGWATTDTAALAGADLGLGWPSPEPRPPAEPGSWTGG
jgi:hypothetical protein